MINPLIVSYSGQKQSKVLPVNDAEFIVDSTGPNGLVAVFEDDGSTGYLYLYEPNGRGVMRHLHVYNRTTTVHPHDADVEVKWSRDSNRCGVFVWGQLRGVMDVVNGSEERAPIHEANTQGITDERWVAGFD